MGVGVPGTGVTVAAAGEGVMTMISVVGWGLGEGLAPVASGTKVSAGLSGWGAASFLPPSSRTSSTITAASSARQRAIQGQRGREGLSWALGSEFGSGAPQMEQ